MKDCKHLNICIVTERPTDGKVIQADKTFVECSDCLEILPIQTVTQEVRIVKVENTAFSYG